MVCCSYLFFKAYKLEEKERVRGKCPVEREGISGSKKERTKILLLVVLPATMKTLSLVSRN